MLNCKIIFDFFFVKGRCCFDYVKLSPIFVFCYTNRTWGKRYYLTLIACWVIFLHFCCRLMIFFKIKFSKNSFRKTIRVSNSLDPNQDRHSVGPDLGANCLQRLTADEKSSLATKGLIWVNQQKKNVKHFRILSIITHPTYHQKLFAS